MKQAIRAEQKKKRDALSEKQVREKSRKIMQRLFSLKELSGAKTIAFYVSVKSEVRTLEMIEQALKAGKRIAVPKVMGQDMQFSEISSLSDLETGLFGIPEPKTSKKISLNEIDAVIVPGVAFDKNCNRIGHGKGYYDRLLNKLSPHTATIGLCFEDNLVESIPAAGNDARVKMVLTEARVLGQ